MKESKCGLLCSHCDYISKCECRGCTESDGHPFHGECSIAKCCIERGWEHCGLCDQFPCEQLHNFAYDPVHGDNGKRLEVLRAWAEQKE